jgi:hypothetical protein
MRTFKVKHYPAPENPDEFFKDHRKQKCSLDCGNESIGVLGGEVHSIYFCLDHEKNALTRLPQIDHLNEYLNIHLKCIYFFPQPVPIDIQQLAKRKGIKELKLYSVDKKSLDCLRAILKSNEEWQSKKEGELDIEMSNDDEN